jgi:hypothetical protein
LLAQTHFPASPSLCPRTQVRAQARQENRAPFSLSPRPHHLCRAKEPARRPALRKEAGHGGRRCAEACPKQYTDHAQVSLFRLFRSAGLRAGFFFNPKQSVGLLCIHNDYVGRSVLIGRKSPSPCQGLENENVGRFSHLRISPQPDGRFTNRPYAQNLAAAPLCRGAS